MRMTHWTFASIGTLMLVSGAVTLACSDTVGDCEKTNSCIGGPAAGSSGGGAPDVCKPGSGTNPVAAGCGIFVATSGNDSNDGSPESPVATFAKAFELASSDTKHVYACAEEFTESLTVPAGITIYGGLDCKESWKYVGDATKTMIAPAADTVAITLSSGDGPTHIADVAAKAADASLSGGSSIAVLVDGVAAEFVRCDFEAGAGRDGDVGATPMDPIGPADLNAAEIRGNDGVKACLNGAADTGGGDEKPNTFCTSVGGKGGAGMVAGGGNGADGQPVPNSNPTNKGAGGIGAGAKECTDGAKGQSGPGGASGAGAAALGVISATGFTSAQGVDGVPGTQGQGGGGGGGAKGKATCAGASGGSGGAGGCGGNGGKGGQAGGSSFAIISLDATLTLTNVTLKTGTGAKGGDGGEGQVGGVGGFGGLGGSGAAMTLEGCLGGRGGSGGFGGKGGGGRGGHSIGIAFKGAAPPDGATITNGEAGEGGLGADEAGNGQAGVKATTQEF